MPAWTSNLSVAEHDVVRSVGFRPVGQVLGISVYQVGYPGAWCASFPGKASNEGTEATGRVKSQYEARRRALGRVTEQAKALGADGVVALRLEVQPFPDVPDTLEVRALGTAVRADGRVHPPSPFLSDLSGQDFAALMMAGWVPAGVALGISVLARHDDKATVLQAGSAGNVEVAGFSALLQGARRRARQALTGDLQRLGADGVVVQELTIATSEHPCGAGTGGQRDHVVEAVILGTAVVRYARRAVPRSPTLQVLRLHDPTSEAR